MTATLVTDWYKGRDMGRGTNRKLTLVFGVAVTGAGCLMAFINAPVFDILLSVAGATLGLLLSILMVGLFLPQATSVGATAGMFAGLIVYCFIRIFIGEFASDDFVEGLGAFGEIRNNTWWDGMFTTCTSAIVAVIVSLRTYTGQAPDSRLLFRGIKG